MRARPLVLGLIWSRVKSDRHQTSPKWSQLTQKVKACPQPGCLRVWKTLGHSKATQSLPPGRPRVGSAGRCMDLWRHIQPYKWHVNATNERSATSCVHSRGLFAFWCTLEPPAPPQTLCMGWQGLYQLQVGNRARTKKHFTIYIRILLYLTVRIV